jgi:hypothetical protein
VFAKFREILVVRKQAPQKFDEERFNFKKRALGYKTVLD